VKWGDGTSSAYPAGCSDPGCPGYASAWVGATTPSDSLAPKYLSVTHTYQTAGIYNVTLEVDDGGPNGHLSYPTQAVIVGVSDLAGPTEARAGTPATYTYTSRFPAGATPVVTPTCEGGTVSGSISSSFTCSFPDVVASTASHAKLHVVVPINPTQSLTFDRTLDVSILPRLTTITPLNGPTTVTEGGTATYTYTETHAPGGLVFEAPSCGLHGHVTFGPPSSVACTFDEVSGPVTTDVSISISALGGTASSSLSVSVMPDTTPPVLTLPGTIRIDSTSNAGAVATFSASAVDAISGPAAVTCSPASGTPFPIGTTTVSCSARDWKQNPATGSFQVVVADVTAPSISVQPTAQTLDATGPGGAVATFTATATDFAPAQPTVTCVPASGSTFAIGTATVTCTSTDAVHNTASAKVTITVRGPVDQIKSLQTYVTSLSIDVKTRNALLADLANALAAVTNNRPIACNQLAAAATVTQNARGSKLTIAQADFILKSISQIRAVLGC